MKSLTIARRERTRRLPRINRQPNDHYAFAGGLNLIDSPLSAEPGQCQGALNYEMGFAGGYQRIGGYATFDGQVFAGNYNLLEYAGKDDRTTPSNAGIAHQPRNSDVGKTVSGVSSGASATLLDWSRDGHFGTNLLLHNNDFEDAVWVPGFTNGPVITADDLAWPGGAVPYLHRWTEQTDGIALKQVLGEGIGEGQQLYTSCFVKYTSGQRDGVYFSIIESVGSIFLAGYVYFDISTSPPTVTLPSPFDLHANAAGAEDMGGGIYRLWWLTQCADDVGTYDVRISMADASVPTISYTTASKYLHIGGAMCVEVYNPFNWRHSMLGYTKANVTVFKGSSWGATANRPANDWSRIEDSSDGAPKEHSMTLPPLTTSGYNSLRIGDKIYLEFYGQSPGAGAIEGINISFPGLTASPVLEINLVDGVATDTTTTSEFESINITEHSTDPSDPTVSRWLVTAVTNAAAVAANEVRIKLITTMVASGGSSTDAMDTSYTGAGTLLNIFGLIGRYGPDPSPSRQYGFAVSGAAEVPVVSGNLVLGEIAGGPFTVGEDLEIDSEVMAEVVSTEILNGETDSTLDARYSALATTYAATAAAAPPGSGPVLGVWMHEGAVYAFRDNTGATQCDMWKATAGGWSQITLNDVVHFDAGDGTEPSEGDTLDGVGSSASAAIKRVVKTSGTWGIDAVGYFVLGTVTGGPYDNDEVLNVSAARVADADGASAVPVLVAGGRYEFRSKNFYGHTDSYRMYGVDGKNFGFEYDADDGVFTQIETGMTVDTPTHVAAHNGHLFFAFAGGSVQLSGDGVPLIWTVITGASEIGVGDEISGFNEEVGNSLFIFTRNQTYVLQGNTRANFDLDDFNINAGAHEWSLQRIGLGCYFDDRGFTTLLQTQRQGSVNFQENAESELIQPLVVDLIKNAQVKCSHLIRNQNVYRCYFDDGRVVSIGFSGHKVSGHMPLEYPFVANVACSEEDSTGGERIFVGADDGTVYELETGTSFDGAAISAFMRTVLYHSGSPGTFKKYQQARLDATLSGALTMTGQIEYDFHDDGFNLADPLDFSTDEAGGYWDDFIWDNFVWDKPTSGIPQVKLEGEGVNAQVYLNSTSASDGIHTLRGVTLQWMPRRGDRRN